MSGRHYSEVKFIAASKPRCDNEDIKGTSGEVFKTHTWFTLVLQHSTHTYTINKQKGSLVMWHLS